MRLIVVGLGIQGRRRLHLLGGQVVATVDPAVDGATFRSLDDVPLASFDAALVCTPDDAKVPLLRDLLRHGKHVLVEKPLLAADATELAQLDALAKEHGASYYTAYNHRFEPAIVGLKKILDARGLGRLYWVGMAYGNGTAQNIRASPWRDAGLGVVADLGSHLLDLSEFLVGKPPGPVSHVAAHRFETRAFDHASFRSEGPPAMEFSVSYVSWKNTFTIDVVGESGSAHVEGLTKWGPSTLRVRKRVFPSGVPQETVETFEGPDATWGTEHAHFLRICKEGATTLRKDAWILEALRGIAKQAGVEGL